MKLTAEEPAADFELSQGSSPVSALIVETHETSVHVLAQRIETQKPLTVGDGVMPVADFTVVLHKPVERN